MPELDNNSVPHACQELSVIQIILVRSSTIFVPVSAFVETTMIVNIPKVTRWIDSKCHSEALGGATRLIFSLIACEPTSEGNRKASSLFLPAFRLHVYPALSFLLFLTVFRLLKATYIITTSLQDTSSILIPYTIHHHFRTRIRDRKSRC